MQMTHIRDIAFC